MNFLETATTAQTVLFYIACISSGLFLVKIFIMFIGGDLEGMSDFEADAGDSDGDFGVFSINTISCFFMGFGWLSLAALKEWDFSLYSSLLVGTSGGILAAGLLIGLLFLAKKLNSEPDVPFLEKGDLGIAYTRIPAKGVGKIQIGNNIVKATSEKYISSFTRIKVLEDITIDNNAVAKVTSI